MEAKESSTPSSKDEIVTISNEQENFQRISDLPHFSLVPYSSKMMVQIPISNAIMYLVQRLIVELKQY